MPAGRPTPDRERQPAGATGAPLVRETVEAVLALVPMAALLIDVPGAGVTFANAAADRMAGGRFPRAASSGEYHEHYLCTDEHGRRIPDTQMPGVRAAAGERLSGFRMHWHLPGGRRSLTVSSERLQLVDGEVALVVFEDITPVERAVSEAEAATGLLESLVDAVPIGVAHLDRELRYAWINSSLAAANGVARDAHVGLRPREILGDELGKAVEAQLQLALDENRPVLGVEYAGTTPEQAGQRWAVDAFPVRSSTGDPLGVGCTVQDVTERTTLLQRERRARQRAEAAEQRARFLARAGDELVRSLDYDTMLQAVASFAVPERADWCAIDVIERGMVRRVAVAHTDPAKERLGWELTRRYPPSLEVGALAEALRTGQTISQVGVTDEQLVAAARDEEHLRLMRELRISGGITVPMRVRGDWLGAITFVYESGRVPDELDVELATELGRRAAVAIENARLYRDRSHIAQVLQRSLLPPRTPTVPGFEVATRYRPAGEGNEVGGDFYDVFQSGAGAWALALGDVCGKGPEAASLTALARWTLRAAALRSDDPADVLLELNAAILHERDTGSTEERFMTAVFATLSTTPDAGGPTVRLACAGHPPPLLVTAGGDVRALDRPGMLLGVSQRPALHEQRIDLPRGDAIVLYTDGLTEAGAPAAPVGLEGLVAAAEGAVGGSAEAIATAVEDAALARSAGRPRDDLAVVVLRRLD